MRRLGLIVNPLAGLGGTVALSGSDGMAAEARLRGAVPRAGARAAEALAPLARVAGIEVCCYAGDMGEAAAHAAGLSPLIVGAARHTPTTAEDTRNAARDAMAAGCELLLFAGGDGTACDLLDASLQQMPVLGIPAGVKMQSGVFATTPAAAGVLAADFLSPAGRSPDLAPNLRDAEVIDSDEDARRRGMIVGRLLGTLCAPDHPRLRQNPKARRLPDEATALAALADSVVRGFDPGVLYLLGPGTTLGAVKKAAGMTGTLAGVDVLSDGRTVARNATERQLLDVLAEPERARLVVSPIGGQGFVFGRGNQQLSAPVLRRVGRTNIALISTTTKLVELKGAGLLVDTGDAELDAELSGWHRVHVGDGQSVVYRIAA
jgi:predicted polyphosphate/ATP-dependent NAD kinase